ncbi:MAG: YidB family protein [Beijerinckiaceae bacterium]
MTTVSNQPRRVTMASKMPSMTALLGLVAIAGYQNRDKIAEMLKGVGATGDKPGSGTQPGLGGVLGNLGGAGATGGVGALLGGGLGELLERFKQSGQEEVAQSWVNDGPNKEIAPPQLKQAIGADVLAALEKQTGLSQDELVARLSRELPAAVDKYTPDGRLPGQNAETLKPWRNARWASSGRSSSGLSRVLSPSSSCRDPMSRKGSSSPPSSASLALS